MCAQGHLGSCPRRLPGGANGPYKKFPFFTARLPGAEEGASIELRWTCIRPCQRTRDASQHKIQKPGQGSLERSCLPTLVRPRDAVPSSEQPSQGGTFTPPLLSFLCVLQFLEESEAGLAEGEGKPVAKWGKEDIAICFIPNGC